MSMTTSQVRLAAFALFWRLALVLLVARQCLVWVAVQRLANLSPARRILTVYLGRWGLRRSLLVAAVAALAITVAADLVVMLIVRPLVRHWHRPRVDPDSGLFHMPAGERVVATMPARRGDARGRRWGPGLLVLTGRRLWFFPADHHEEAWSVPRAELVEVRLRPAPPAAWGFLLGWPDHFTLATADGARERFAVADPHDALSWFKPARADVDAPGPSANDHDARGPGQGARDAQPVLGGDRRFPPGFLD